MQLLYLVDQMFNTFKIGELSVLQVCAKVVIIRIEYNPIASYWIIYMYKSYRTKVLILREYYNNDLVVDNLLTMGAIYHLLELSHISHT